MGRQGGGSWGSIVTNHNKEKRRTTNMENTWVRYDGLNHVVVNYGTVTLIFH